MADEQEGLIIVGSDGTEHEFPTGMDPQKAASVVREQEAYAKQGPMVRSRTGQMYRGPEESGAKEFIGGAVDAVKGTLNPMNYVRGAASVATHPLDSALEVAKTPFRMAGGLITDPAHTLGAITGGALAGKLVPIAVKPAARNIGSMVERIGTKGELAMQISGSHQLLAGNPIAGAAMMATPPVLRAVGRKLKDFGADPAMFKADADAMLQRGGATAPPAGAIRVSPPARDFYDTATQNTAEAAAAKGGRSAAAVDPSAPPVGWPAGVPYDKSKLVGEIQPLRKGPKVTTLTEAPPDGPKPIRVLGKAAQDLAEGKATPAPIHGPASTLDDLATKLGTGVNEDAAVLNHQLQTENSSRLANRNGRVPADSPAADALAAPRGVIRPGQMSATPGWSKNSIESVGLDPAVDYTGRLKPETMAKMNQLKDSRALTNYNNAKMDKAGRAGLGDLKSILEQSLLMRENLKP